MNTTLRTVLFWVALAVLIVLFIKMAGVGFGPREAEPSFTEFMDKVKAGQVVEVELRGNQVVGVYRDQSKFKTYIPPEFPEVYKVLLEQNVRIKVKDAAGPSWLTWGVNLLPLLLLIGFWIFIMR